MISIPPNISNFPKFMTSNLNYTSLILWSQPSFDKFIGSILTSTGGIMGLYAFIIITIGQFVRMWTKSLLEDLWLSRLSNPTKLLNIILAIEAYQIDGDLENEFDLSQKLLENMRTKSRMVQIADGKEDIL